MALQREFLDSATVPPETRVLVTGEMTGSMTLPLDETEYTYPLIEARHLEVLPRRRSRPDGDGPTPTWALTGDPTARHIGAPGPIRTDVLSQ